MSLVKVNLMNREGYSPYCGHEGKCSGHWPRTKFNGTQFKCPDCGWVSEFDTVFIKHYKLRWGIK